MLNQSSLEVREVLERNLNTVILYEDVFWGRGVLLLTLDIESRASHAYVMLLALLADAIIYSAR